MTTNYGKKFENVIKEAFEKVPDVSIDRLHDQTTGFRGSSNICDFIVYREPYEYYFECKSVHGNRLPFRNITETQRTGLLQKSFIEGVFAGIICWWIDKDKTLFLPIQTIKMLANEGFASYYYDWDAVGTVEIKGKKKRVFFDYDMEEFLNELPNL